MSDKQTLRRMIRLRKQQHTADESPVIIERLKQNAHFLFARTLLLYYALPDEVQTQHLIDELVKQGKTVLLPRVVSDTDMELCRYTGQQDLKKGGLNVWEPVGERFTDYEQIDVAVIPGMAFDHKGHRLGRGKGYYDRMLAHISPQATHLYKIGICFPWQMVDAVSTDEHDVMMDEVVTKED